MYNLINYNLFILIYLKCFLCLIQHQYDKIVEERDSELGLYKSREQEQSSVKAALVRQNK